MCGCNEIITVSISYWVVTTIRNNIGLDIMCLQKVVHIWRIIPMGQKTPGPCLLEVSHGIRYKLLRVGSSSALGKGYCGLFG